MSKAKQEVTSSVAEAVDGFRSDVTGRFASGYARARASELLDELVRELSAHGVATLAGPADSLDALRQRVEAAAEALSVQERAFVLERVDKLGHELVALGG